MGGRYNSSENAPKALNFAVPLNFSQIPARRRVLDRGKSLWYSSLYLILNQMMAPSNIFLDGSLAPLTMSRLPLRTLVLILPKFGGVYPPQ